jgi:hypothetical protein
MPLQLYDKSVSGSLSATDSYYNLIIKNNNTGYDISGNPIPVPTDTPVIFNENRTIPYLYNAKDHFASVISFQLDTSTLPVFICEPVVGDSNVNNTIYFFSICLWSGIGTTYGTLVKQRIQWQPENKSVPVPPSPVASDYSNNPYYYSNTYEHFISLLNDQLATAWATVDPIFSPGPPPFFLFENGSITAYANTSMITRPDGVPLGNNLAIFFNTELYSLFSGLPSIKQFETPNNLNQNYQILFPFNISGENIVTLYTDVTQTTSYQAIKSRAEFSPLSFWNPIDSIIITANYLNTVPELVTSNSPSVETGGRVASNAEQYYILFDYMAPNYGASDYHPSVKYEPNAEYRLTDMYGVGEVNQLEVRTLWKDKWGILHPFTLKSGSSSAIKLLFRKKRFYE